MSGKVLIGIAILAWSFWGVFGKMSQLRLYPAQVSIMIASTSAFTIPIYLRIMQATGNSFVWDWRGILTAFLAGLCGAAAGLAYNFALRTESLGVVVGMTSCYPALTFLFSIFLFNEQVTVQKVIGLFSVLFGVWLLGK